MTHDDLLRDMDWARKSFEDAGVHGTEGARQIIEAAQAIRDLQAQNAKLREALEWIGSKSEAAGLNAEQIALHARMVMANVAAMEDTK